MAALRRAAVGAPIAAMVLSLCANAEAAETIVGTWAPNPAQCTPVGGLISIGALSLTADELSCRFTNVSRVADVVTWHGRCSDGEASRPATVVAALSQGRLSVMLHSTWSGPYRRCIPQRPFTPDKEPAR